MRAPCTAFCLCKQILQLLSVWLITGDITPKQTAVLQLCWAVWGVWSQGGRCSAQLTGNPNACGTLFSMENRVRCALYAQFSHFANSSTRILQISSLSLAHPPPPLRATITILHSGITPLTQSTILRQSATPSRWWRCTLKHFEFLSLGECLCWKTGSWRTSTIRIIPPTRRLRAKLRYVC